MLCKATPDFKNVHLTLVVKICNKKTSHINGDFQIYQIL